MCVCLEGEVGGNGEGLRGMSVVMPLFRWWVRELKWNMGKVKVRMGREEEGREEKGRKNGLEEEESRKVVGGVGMKGEDSREE